MAARKCRHGEDPPKLEKRRECLVRQIALRDQRDLHTRMTLKDQDTWGMEAHRGLCLREGDLKLSSEKKATCPAEPRGIVRDAKRQS